MTPRRCSDLWLGWFNDTDWGVRNAVVPLGAALVALHLNRRSIRLWLSTRIDAVKPRSVDRWRIAARLARTAAGHTLDEVADAAGVDPHGLRNHLLALPTRGRCAQLLTDRAAPVKAIAVAACPAGVVRAGASLSNVRGWGTPGWERMLYPDEEPAPIRVCGPRLRQTAPATAAAHLECPSALLEHLSNHEDPRTRIATARNPACPTRLLQRLANDEDNDVRCSVAQHHHCPTETLKCLAGDDAWTVRLHVAQNVCCSSDTLEEIAVVDEDPDVVAAAFQNPALNDEALRRRVAHDDWQHRRMVAALQRCPSDLLETLAEDPDIDVRRAVANNPECPFDLLERLVEDNDSEVAHAALSNLQESAHHATFD